MWFNTNLQLFEITKNGPRYLKGVGIEKICWDGNIKNGPVVATITLISSMPDAKNLYELVEPFDCEVCYIESGQRDDYESQTVIMGIYNLTKIGKIKMYNVIAQGSDYADAISVVVNFEGLLTIFE